MPFTGFGFSPIALNQIFDMNTSKAVRAPVQQEPPETIEALEFFEDEDKETTEIVNQTIKVMVQREGKEA